MTPPRGLVHLRNGGVSLLLDAGAGLPTVLHWGADLGDLPNDAALARALLPAIPHSATDVPVRRSLFPMPSDAWRMRPALRGARLDGRDSSPRFVLRTIAVQRDSAARLTAGDEETGIGLVVDLRLHPSGVLEVRQAVRNEGATPYAVAELAASLPLPAHAVEILDLTGRWGRERSPQRHPLLQGCWLREGRHGRTGHDATMVLAVGTPGFSFRSGEVWAGHLGWSGDGLYWAERSAQGHAQLGGAELLAPGEVVLDPGEEYLAPAFYATYSADGLDGISRAYHRYIRARPGHPTTLRPVILNTWEATYFNQRLDRLTNLADVAARLGVERFVLDDGWFGDRRGDTAGLGDWYVSEVVWPEGLRPLIDHVVGLGMQFGLWVEPEMVNPDSGLYRAHPDWVLGPAGRLPVPWRSQQVLDLVNPKAYAHILGRLDALLSEHDIGYLKWDHNRNLIEAQHAGRPGVRAQTLAVYRLLDELRVRHPTVEIESCASGGARIDLGILARTDRVWPSDTNDALERQMIQRWTGLLLPAELIGAHVGSPHAHTTGRAHALSFRIATALFGHLGVEWDVTTASAQEQQDLADAIRFYKEIRGLLHTGDVVRVDHPDPAAYVHGVVAVDRAEAIFAYVQLATSATETPALVRLAGLADDRSYRVSPVTLAGGPDSQQIRGPGWVLDGGCTLTGRVLTTVGLPAPVLRPEQALLLHVVAG